MFTVFKKILNKSEITDLDLEKINDFIFCRWLSGNPNTIMVANVINYYHKLPLKIKVKFVEELIGKKIKYIPFPKQEKTEDLKYICNYFNISEDKAIMYAEFLKEEDFEYLRNLEKQNG